MRRLIFTIIMIIAVLGVAYYVLSPVEARVFAVDAQSGQVMWSAAIPSEGSLPNLAVEGNRVYVGVSNENENDLEADNLTLMAFDTNSGSLVWEFNFDPATFGNTHEYTWKYSPFVLQDTVYVALNLHNTDAPPNLVAIDAKNGNLKWVLEERAPVEMDIPIHAASERLVALLQDETGYSLNFLNPETGEILTELWHSTLEDRLNLTFRNPYILGNQEAVYLATENAVRAYDLNTGEELFTIETDEGARVLLSETTLYVQQSFTGITAHNPITADVQWEYKTDALPDETYLTYFRMSEDTIYAVCQCGARQNDEVWLIAIDAQNGTQRWTKVLTDYDPTAWFTIPAPFPEGVAVSSNTDIIALTSDEGAELWRFKRSIGVVQPVSNGEQVFIIDQSEKYNHLLRR